MFQSTLQYLTLRRGGIYLSYGLTIAAIGGVGVAGARGLTNAFVDMAARAVDDNPRPLSRVERHLQVVARAEARKPIDNDDDDVVALVQPAMHPVRLAAAMDQAERPDLPADQIVNARPIVLGWSKESPVHGRTKALASQSKLALATRKVRKGGKPAAVALADATLIVQSDVGASAPFGGKMALLPKGSFAKAVQVIQPPTKPFALSAASLPSRPRATTPGEIIRISLLGAN